MGSGPNIGEEQWVIIGRRWDCIYGRKNICSKQQETQRKDSTRESWLSRCRASKTTMNARIDQEKLLVTRAKGRCQEIYTRLFQMPIKQSPTSKEIRRATPIGNISRTMAKN